MRRRRLKHVRARLAKIDMPRPFTVEALCEQLAGERGRPLYLHELPQPLGPGEPCGMWIATEAADHIYHARGTSPLHQQNIVLHEIGHMLCDHRGTSPVLSLLDPAVVQRVLHRNRYSTPEEEEAELMAALILERAEWGREPLGDIDDLY